MTIEEELIFYNSHHFSKNVWYCNKQELFIIVATFSSFEDKRLGISIIWRLFFSENEWHDMWLLLSLNTQHCVIFFSWYSKKMVIISISACFSTCKGWYSSMMWQPVGLQIWGEKVDNSKKLAPIKRLGKSDHFSLIKYQ